MQCHIPPLVEIPKGTWKCCECAAVEYKRMMRCGECQACLRDDCGKCVFCKDKPKFGGPGKLKQVCQLKKCNYMRLAPPASRKSISDQDIKNQFKSAKPYKGDTSNERVQRKRKEPSTTPSGEDDSRVQKKRLKKASMAATDKTGTKPLPMKLITSIDIVDTSLAYNTMGSKIRTVISTAAKKIDKPEVQTHACQYLRVFITDDKSSEVTIKLGGLLMLAKAMYEHTNDISVQIEAMKTLTKLVVKNKTCGEDIIGSGCLALAIESMVNHKSVFEVHQALCTLLRALSYDFRVHPFIMSCRGVEAISTALKSNASRLDALLDGFFFFQNLLCNPRVSTEASNMFLAQGILSVIVNGISLFPRAPYIRASCAVVTNLAIKTVSRNGISVDKQCVEKVLSILDIEVDIDTKKLGLETLKALSIGKDRFASDFVDCGGIKKVLDLMKSAPNDVLLSRLGMQLMVDLTSNKENIQLFATAGGFGITVNQMNASRNTAFVQATGCRILRRLFDVPGLEDGTAGDTIYLIFSALSQYDDDDIQFDGRHALLNIISQCPSVALMLQANKIREMNTQYLAEEEELDVAQVSSVEDGSSPTEEEEDSRDYTVDAKDDHVCQKIKAIISKASNHLDDNKVQDKACEQLRKLIKDEKENAIKVLQMGGIEIIVDAMKAHPDKSIVQGEACATLTHLAWVYPKANKNIVAAGSGCLPLVVQALKNHPNNNKVQQMGCGVFRTLSYENENHYFINSVNGIDVMLDSMYNNSNKPAVVKEFW